MRKEEENNVVSVVILNLNFVYIVIEIAQRKLGRGRRKVKGIYAKSIWKTSE